MLDRIDAGGDRDRCALSLRVSRDALPARMDRLNSQGELVGGEGDLVTGAPGVGRDLHQIRPRVHLCDRGVAELVAGIDEDDEGRELVASREPRPGREDLRGVGTSANAIADPKVQPVWRSDVASGEDAHARERARRVVAPREQLRFGISEAGEPVRATQTGQVRVAIDESGNDRGARCVDGVGIARISRAVARAEVRDPAIAHEQGHPALEPGRAPVGEGRPAQERRGYRALFRPMERMKPSIGIALSVSICTVPRAPSPTDTRAMVSLSFASTMFTKS